MCTVEPEIRVVKGGGGVGGQRQSRTEGLQPSPAPTEQNSPASKHLQSPRAWLQSSSDLERGERHVSFALNLDMGVWRIWKVENRNQAVMKGHLGDCPESRGRGLGPGGAAVCRLLL